MAVENAIGRLKGRWRCLMKRNDVDLKIMPNVIATCCIPHNICEIQKDNFLPEGNVQESEVGGTTMDATSYDGENDASAERIQATIAANLQSMFESDTREHSKNYLFMFLLTKSL